MKKNILISCLILLVSVSCLKQAKEEFKPLFNGKDQSGWRNPYDRGKVEVKDGEFHLTAEKKFFLVTEKEYSDFIFEGDVHLPEGKANSGFMFRCHVEPNKCLATRPRLMALIDVGQAVFMMKVGINGSGREKKATAG